MKLLKFDLEKYTAMHNFAAVISLEFVYLL